MNRTTFDRKQLAHWGAAHALLATVGNVGIVKITMKPQSNCLAFAQYEPRTTMPTIDEMRRHLELCLSGALAVGQFDPSIYQQARMLAIQIVEANCCGTVDDEMAQARQRVLLVLDQKRDSIERLTALLMERDTLTAADVTAALN